MRLIIAALFLFCPLASAAAAPPPLAFCYEDVGQRPWTTPEGTGLNFDLLRRVERLLGEKFVFSVKPWKRCLEEVRIGLMDALIGAADSPERRTFALVPTLADGRADPGMALYEDNYTVFLRRAGHASWDGRTLLPKGGVVAVQSGYLVASLLRERGYLAEELVKSPADGLRLLVTGTHHVAILYGREPVALARRDPRFSSIEVAAVPYETLGFHLLVGRQTYQRDPGRIAAVWRAIATVRKSPEYRKLEAAAGVVR